MPTATSVKYALMISVSAVALAAPAMADTIFNPDGNAGNRVFANDGEGDFLNLNETGDIAGGRLVIGFSGDSGALEVNAETGGNGITALTDIRSLEIGQRGPDEDGLLRLRGDGAPGSVTMDVTSSFRLGGNSDSRLEILSGAQVSLLTPPETRLGTAFIGTFSDLFEGQGEASVLVDGEGSLFDVNGRIDLGAFNDGGSDSMVISNGARVVTREPADIADRVAATEDPFEAVQGDFAMTGDFDGGIPETDRLTITGAGSELVVSSGFFTASGDQRIVISDGGALRQEEVGDIDSAVALFPDFFDAGDFGLVIRSGRGDSEMLVTGDGSTVAMTRDIRIGIGEVFSGFDDNDEAVINPSDGLITVTDGAVMRTTRAVEVSDVAGEGFGRLVVGEGGRVEADTLRVNGGGLLSGDGGLILADVILNGGTIAPGASPGVMTIDGDLNVLDGLLSFEIGGATPGLFDQLFVFGDLLTPNGLEIEISFIDGFTPDSDNVFDLLTVDGAADIFATPDLIALSVLGLAPGSGFSLNFADGGLAFSGPDAGGPAVAPIPLPAPFAMLAAALGGLGLFGRAARR